ncbi:thioredoxin family protein [Helicobacter kayseriensis]|uniref:thioredoxin family protein n=1 Tax=Helicobacter kayseriensis TaxID=2905877 RepID=UPI001E4E52E5|nr:thioredoxin family protein [Helicobacter kayseriensis]MCE3047284.1 thioredoxin family protein [Helicobacter kayseriensis]MCE3048655.1 thioredoxin family protein [Helicobacter kayseriensis]
MVENIDASQYEAVSKNENCLVVFGATWCKDCVKIEPFLKDLSEEFASLVKIYKVDSRQEEELSASLNIRAIPTLIFYRNGVEVGTRLVEPQNKQLIAEAIEQNFS